MADTIEWLETIGKDARLRHAPSEELASTLAMTDASEALKATVISGDRTLLSAELGYQSMNIEHNIYGPSHEEEPDHEDGDQPVQPDPNQPSRDP
jgi:hypothetical protein